jgi:hypothetical protein
MREQQTPLVSPDAPSLADCLAGGPLPLTAALGYAAAMARTLGSLHREGLAHGGVVPEAIRVSGRSAVLSSPGGDAEAATPRDDASAFGAVLEKMLTGAGQCGDPIHDEALHLAARCSSAGEGAADLRKVATQIRVLRLMAELRDRKPRLPATPPPVRANPSPEPAAKAPPTPENRKPAIRPLAKCPHCNGPVHQSRASGFSEQVLHLLRFPLRRCHWCYRRYTSILGVPVNLKG